MDFMLSMKEKVGEKPDRLKHPATDASIQHRGEHLVFLLNSVGRLQSHRTGGAKPGFGIESLMH
jgi:hypothetical protein